MILSPKRREPLHPRPMAACTATLTKYGYCGQATYETAAEPLCYYHRKMVKPATKHRRRG